MVFISIYPFASRKLLLLVVAFLCLSSAFCFADSLFLMRRYASDRYRVHAASVVVNTNQSNRLVSPFVGEGRADSGREGDVISSEQSPVAQIGAGVALGRKVETLASVSRTEIGSCAQSLSMEEMADPTFVVFLFQTQGCPKSLPQSLLFRPELGEGSPAAIVPPR